MVETFNEVGIVCGIAGCFGEGSNELQGTIEAMLEVLSRRGPDDSGIYASDLAVLGHRRLAVFDTSAAGHQPMLLGDRLAITFNGAIYNFRELRSELEGHGIRFRSATDTEVLLQGYAHWGLHRMVERLRGAFAFALWDSKYRVGYLVRDRLGVKPLCYAKVGPRFLFASSASALGGAGIGRAMSTDAIAHFLSNGFVNETNSLYEGVEKLPPATIATWDGRGELRLETYWRIPNVEENTVRSFGDAVDQTEDLLLEATRLRLHADVPVAALLSGGIDSALVCWAARESGVDLRSYTVSVPGDATDESFDARRTAEELGSNLTVLPLSRPTIEILDELNNASGEPFAVESALGMLRISAAVASTDTRVLLTGDGGDDVFLGYPRHRHLLAAQRLRRVIPESGRRALRMVSGWVPGSAAVRRPKRLLDYAAGGLPAFLNAGFGLHDYASKGLLGDRFNDDPQVITHAVKVGNSDSILSDYLEYDYQTQFVSEYLSKVDITTMHHAIEARSPFLDQLVWEYASVLPFNVRLHRGVLKAVLREIARRRISARVAFGRKRGFRVPVQRWVVGDWSGHVRERLLDGSLTELGIVRQRPLEQLVRGATIADGQMIWYLLVLASWISRQANVRTLAVV